MIAFRVGPVLKLLDGWPELVHTAASTVEVYLCHLYFSFIFIYICIVVRPKPRKKPKSQSKRPRWRLVWPKRRRRPTKRHRQRRVKRKEQMTMIWTMKMPWQPLQRRQRLKRIKFGRCVGLCRTWVMRSLDLIIARTPF